MLVCQLCFRNIKNGKELFNWHKARDYVSSKIEVKKGKFGNGLFANKAILEGEILFTIQPDNQISTDYAREVHCHILFLL